MFAVNLGSMDTLTILVLSPCHALVSRGLQSPLTCLRAELKGEGARKGGAGALLVWAGGDMSSYY